MSKMSKRLSVRVTNPCSEAWEEMAGNDQVRFCSHCAKSVNNLSAMNRKDALRLVKRSEGNICIRYIQDPKTREPLFAERLHQISRRAPALAAGVIGATLSFASATYAQGDGRLVRSAVTRPAVDPEIPEKTGEVKPVGDAVVFGTVFDPNGAVVAGVGIRLVEPRQKIERSSTTSIDGGFRFEGVPEGSYMIIVDGGDVFADKSFADISVAKTGEVMQLVHLEPEKMRVVVGAMIAIDDNDPSNYRTELSKGVYSEELEDVLALLTAGNGVNEANADGSTPLFISVNDGTAEITRLLLSYGADVNHRNDEDETAIFMLSSGTPGDLIEHLLSAGAKINIKAKDGSTPLIRAAEDGSPEVVKLLIDAGADLNEADEKGETALIRAAFADDLEKVRMLLLAGAEVNKVNKAGETALDQVADAEVEALLISFGAVEGESDDSDDDDDGPT